jgi:hypothetical protein
MTGRIETLTAALLFVSIAACSDDVDPTEATVGDSEGATSGVTEGQTEGQTEGATEGETEGETEGDTEGEAPQHVDLFACEGLSLSCEQITVHIDGEPAEAVECAAHLVVSTDPGLLSVVDAPGPNIDEVEHLMVILGDGTAILQTRERHCGIDEDCDPNLPWEAASAHQVCDVEVAEGLAAACDPACETECYCRWEGLGQLRNCETIEDWSCDDALAALQGG